MNYLILLTDINKLLPLMFFEKLATMQLKFFTYAYLLKPTKSNICCFSCQELIYCIIKVDCGGIALEACLYGTIYGPAVDCRRNMISIVQKWKHFVAFQTAECRVA